MFSFSALAVLLLGANLQPQRQEMRIGGALAAMTVSAEARSGAALPVVALKDVRVTEGRSREQDMVVSWTPAQGDRAGLDLLVVIDDGSSWELASHFTELRAFMEEEPATTKIGVGYMRYGRIEMAQNFTADHEKAAKSLRMPMGTAGISGSPFFALQDMMKRWPSNNENPRHEILMISSGIDPYSSGSIMDPHVAEAIADLQRADVVVYTLYEPGAGHSGHSFWRMNMGQNYLSEISEETGGESYYIGLTPAVSFTPYLDELAGQLRHQFLLEFIPKPQQKAGLQPVHVTTGLRGVDLVAADAVFVPAAGDWTD